VPGSSRGDAPGFTLRGRTNGNHGRGSVVSTEREHKTSVPPLSTEAVGMLVAFVQMNGFE
jgi:hypothetical protein